MAKMIRDLIWFCLVSSTDSVYIESQRADLPFFICTIQEFKRVSRDSCPSSHPLAGMDVDVVGLSVFIVVCWEKGFSQESCCVNKVKRLFSLNISLQTKVKRKRARPTFTSTFGVWGFEQGRVPSSLGERSPIKNKGKGASHHHVVG